MSGFDPTTVPGLVAWWTPKFGVVAPNGGQFVSWTAAFGGFLLVPSTGTLIMVPNGSLNTRPQLQTSAGAGATATCAALSVSQPNTTYIVFNKTSTTSLNITDGAIARQISGMLTSTPPSGAPYMYAGTQLASPTNSNGPIVHCALFNGVSSSLYINSSAVPVVTGNAGTNGISSLSFGNGSGIPMGAIGDMLFYSGLHGPAERCAVMTWLGSSYAIPGCG